MTAFEKVKANKGGAGVDGVTIEDFEKDLKKQPLQDMEQNVIGVLLSHTGRSGKYTEKVWWREGIGYPNGQRPSGANCGKRQA